MDGIEAGSSFYIEAATAALEGPPFRRALNDTALKNFTGGFFSATVIHAVARHTPPPPPIPPSFPPGPEAPPRIVAPILPEGMLMPLLSGLGGTFVIFFVIRKYNQYRKRRGK